MRYVLALLFLAHGVAHLPGFLVAWRLRVVPELPHTTTVLDGSLDIGEAGMRVLGLAWLACAVACAAVAVAAIARAPWWTNGALAVVAASIVLCLLGWPAARLGLLMNAILVALLWSGARMGWLG